MPFKLFSYVVSRGRVAPVVRTLQRHQTQAATVYMLILPPHCLQDSNQIGLYLTVEVIEPSHETAQWQPRELVHWHCC